MNIYDKYRARKRITGNMLTKATTEDLVTLKELVDREIGAINDQLIGVKNQVKINGIYADPDWYRRVNSAKRFKGQLSQRIQNELGRRKRDQKRINQQKNGKSQFKSLLEAMKLVLTEEQVESVLDTWRQIR